MTEPVVKKITVGCSAARAFEIFVQNTANWWPLDRHSVSAMDGKTAQSLVIEPRLGGSVYEVTADGNRSDWGRIVTYEPASMLAMTWHPGQASDKATRVEVSFREIAAGKAQITLTHSGWEALGEAAQSTRDGYNSGWDLVFTKRFSEACEHASAE